MRVLITKIEKKPSYRGGVFTWFFMKCVDSGRAFRTCTAVEFRNWGGWAGVKVGDTLDGVKVKYGTLVDADCAPVKVKV